MALFYNVYCTYIRTTRHGLTIWYGVSIRLDGGVSRPKIGKYLPLLRSFDLFFFFRLVLCVNGMLSRLMCDRWFHFLEMTVCVWLDSIYIFFCTVTLFCSRSVCENSVYLCMYRIHLGGFGFDSISMVRWCDGTGICVTNF